MSHSLGQMALKRHREHRVNGSIHGDGAETRSTAIMHMIFWRGLRSNHMGLVALTREYLNPHPPTSTNSEPSAGC